MTFPRNKHLIDICPFQCRLQLYKLQQPIIFHTENSTVTVLITREEFCAIQSEQFVDNTFCGSLPAFIAAFTTRKTLSAEEIAQIRQMIDRYGEG